LSYARSPTAHGTAEDYADLGRRYREVRREEDLGALRHQDSQCAAAQDAGSTARSPPQGGGPWFAVVQDAGSRLRRAGLSTWRRGREWRGDGHAPLRPRPHAWNRPAAAGKGWAPRPCPRSCPRPHVTSLPPERWPSRPSACTPPAARSHATGRIAPAWNGPSFRHRGRLVYGGEGRDAGHAALHACTAPAGRACHAVPPHAARSLDPAYRRPPAPQAPAIEIAWSTAGKEGAPAARACHAARSRTPPAAQSRMPPAARAREWCRSSP
jgi:hypothetical protein